MAGDNVEIARRAVRELGRRDYAGSAWDPEAFGDFALGPWASILWISGGRIVRAEGHLSKRRAMRAAGLEAPP